MSKEPAGQTVSSVKNSDSKRIEFTVTKDMEKSLKKLKAERFCDRSQSEMIHELILEGMRATEQERAAKENRRDKEGQKGNEQRTSRTEGLKV